MSYRLYHTEGFVLGGLNFGEAHRLVYLLTRDLGLVAGVARGVRRPSAKLAGHLTNLCHLYVSLVRGRESWRITTAEKTPLLANIFSSPEKLAVWARLARLLRRLVRGEAPEPNLFREFRAGLVFLDRHPLGGEVLTRYELVMTLRLLYRLGYLDQKTVAAPFLRRWSELTPADLPINRRFLASLAQKALSQTQL